MATWRWSCHSCHWRRGALTASPVLWNLVTQELCPSTLATRSKHRDASGTARTPVVAVVLALLGVLICTTSALAQRADRLSVDATFGWPDDLGVRSQTSSARTVIVPERWCPATVRIAGPEGGPLIDAFDGFVTFDYVQDATQRARVALRVAGTPGRVITAQAALCVPRSVQDIDVTVTDANGRVRAMATYTSQMRRDGDQPLPEIAALESVGLLAVGRVPAVPGAVLNDLRPRDSNGWDYQTRAFSGHIEAANLPAIPTAYASLGALVVDAEEPIDARVQAAIREWVIGGGRLLIIADKPGGAWRAWLPPGAQGDFVSVATPATVELPGDLRGIAALPLPAPAKPKRNPNHYQNSNTVVNPTEPSKPSDAAMRVAARGLSLTPSGLNHGWTTAWPIEPAGSAAPAIAAPKATANADARPAGPVLLVSGPVGFGLVTVLGIDPRRSNIDHSNPAADRVWAHALRPLLIDAEPPGRTDDGQPTYLSDWYISSGESGAGAAALGAAMNLLGDEPPVDGLVIVVTSLCMCGLVLMLGPGDYFILRQRRRHVSWMTALGWIVLACAAAYIGPSIVRGSDSRMQRLSCVDVLEPDAAGDTAGSDGASASASGTSPVPSLALDSSLTVFWSGRTAGVSVVDEDGAPTAISHADGRAWRGASALSLQQYDQPGMLVPRLNFMQRPASIDASRDAWGGLGGSAVDGSQAATTAPAPDGLDLRRWTLRATLDSGRDVPLVRARAVTDRDANANVRFEVRSVPAGAVLVRAAARLGPERTDWCQALMRGPPEITPRGTQVLTLYTERDAAAAEHFARNTTRDHYTGHYYGNYGVSETDPFEPGDALELPTVSARHPAIEARLKSGRWAALYLEFENLPMDVRFTLEGRSSRRAIVRVLVPLP